MMRRDPPLPKNLRTGEKIPHVFPSSVLRGEGRL